MGIKPSPRLAVEFVDAGFGSISDQSDTSSISSSSIRALLAVLSASAPLVVGMGATPEVTDGTGP